MSNGYLAVDLDGTLAHYDGWAEGEIGEPVPAMLARVKAWLKDGQDVRIMTARVSSLVEVKERAMQRSMVRRWCIKHLGEQLPVIAEKDFGMICLYDDRAVQIEANTGRMIEDVSKDVPRHSCDCDYCPYVEPPKVAKKKKVK